MESVVIDAPASRTTASELGIRPGFLETALACTRLADSRPELVHVSLWLILRHPEIHEAGGLACRATWMSSHS
jgi:hypothetical protein